MYIVCLNLSIITTNSIASPDGTITSFKTFSGENNPVKKQNIEKRDYNQISNWKDGCPDCTAKSSTYEAFRKHRSRGCGSSDRVICKVCSVEIAKSNTAHLKKCPNKNKNKK